jgi:8-oxo-dGTP diphosphatase
MIDVTCAIIINDDNEVLVVQRDEMSDHPFKWEFPGGKLREEETEEECIEREIHEELSMGIVIRRRLVSTEYDYGNKQIRLIPFLCDTFDDLPFLTEHIAYKWIDPAELASVDFCEADIIVANEYLRNCRIETAQSRDLNGKKLTYSEEDLISVVSNIGGLKEIEWFTDSTTGNRETLKKLFDYSFSDDKKLAFKASWTLSKIFEKYPGMFSHDLQLATERIGSIANESVQRSFLKMISMSDLTSYSQKLHGILADHCFNMLRSGFSAVAVKAYSMEIIYKLALIYPELKDELSATIGILMGEGTAGIVARGYAILKKLKGTSENHLS